MGRGADLALRAESYYGRANLAPIDGAKDPPSHLAGAELFASAPARQQLPGRSSQNVAAPIWPSRFVIQRGVNEQSCPPSQSEGRPRSAPSSNPMKHRIQAGALGPARSILITHRARPAKVAAGRRFAPCPRSPMAPLAVSGGLAMDQSRAECERLNFARDPCANDRKIAVMSGYRRMYRTII